MAIYANPLGKRSKGIQYKIASSGSFDIAAAIADGAAPDDDHEVFEVPAGAVITDVHVIPTTTVDGTTPTINVDLQDLGGGNPVALAAGVSPSARSSTAVTAARTTAPKIVTVNSTAADSTVGVGSVEVEYYVDGRSNENEG